MPNSPKTLLIASPLEDEHVARLRALAPERLQVLHDQALLPHAALPADHNGDPAFQRTPEQQARWQAMLSRATILFDLPAAGDLPLLSQAGLGADHQHRRRARGGAGWGWTGWACW